MNPQLNPLSLYSVYKKRSQRSTRSIDRGVPWREARKLIKALDRYYEEEGQNAPITHSHIGVCRTVRSAGMVMVRPRNPGDIRLQTGMFGPHHTQTVQAFTWDSTQMRKTG